MRISNNLMAMNANRMLGITETKKKDSVQKLSSGYKINRAADDAAGLSISEKMRRLIRGLDQGTENAQDGVSWTQTGDGALNEAHDILHRMTELTVKALNETNTDSDRMDMEMEFEALQSELDRISQTATFNEIPIFEQHEIPYYQCEGAVSWDPQQIHVVSAGQNDLTFKYRDTENGAQKTMTITVPAGEYTTQELVDEIDDALLAKNSGDSKIVFEFTGGGTCNANLEGGEKIDSVYGGLSYLMYDMYRGGGYGALIGTTSFPTENSRLKVVTGQNNAMTFDIENFAGGSMSMSINIPAGSYTRSELIDILNNQLAGSTVKATAYGSGIKLSSDDAIVTGFKGNMFKIDGSGTIYNSVFYDNVKYGSVTQEPAKLIGGYIIPTDARDAEHGVYRIDSSNNTLTLQPNGAANPVDIIIPDGEYTVAEMATKLNELFTAENLDIWAFGVVSGGFGGIQINSRVEGPDSVLNVDTNSSAYNTLFVTKEYNQYGSKATLDNETTADKEGAFTGSKDLSALSTTPLTITAGVNDKFTLSLNGSTYEITMTATTYNSVDDVVAELEAQLNGANALAGYKGKLTVSQNAGKLVLTGNAGQGVNTVETKAITGNGGFDALFQGYRVSTSTPTASGNGSVTLNQPYDGVIDAGETSMKITVNGNTTTVDFPSGALSRDDVKNTIENAIPPRTETTDNIFNTVTDNGSNTNNNFSRTVRGTTSSPSWGDTETGNSTEKEGVVGFITNNPAKLTVEIPLKNSMKVTSSNNTISLTLNGVRKNIVLAEATYSPESLKNALQSQIDKEFGTGMGGAIVSIANNKLVLTSRLPDGYDGADTSISCSTTSSSFLQELNTTKTAANWTSTNNLASSIAIDDSNREFTFQYTEKNATQTITLTLDKGTYNATTIAAEINKQLAKTGTGITAEVSGGKLKMTSSAVGNDVAISYNTTTGGNSAESIFGPLNVPHAADILVNMNTQSTIKIEAGVSDTFTIKVNGVDQTVTLDSGEYDITQFKNMLNTKLSAIGVEAYTSGNKLGYRTLAKGSSESIAMSYAGGGNSMKAIYGETTTTYPGVTVSFNANNQMVLSSTTGSGTISVSGTTGGAFQQPVVTSTPINPSKTTGYHSSVKSYIDGVSLSGDVTIDQWNNNLNFTYLKNGVSQDVSIEVPAGITYTQADLETKLQELIDAEVGADQIKVTVSGSGVRLEAVNPGSKYQFSSFSGDFYDKVMCACTEVKTSTTAKELQGTQTVNSAYTVGRKNVRNGDIDIRHGISDELTLDLTYGNAVHTITVQLDPRHYTGEELKDHLQEKINEQLVNTYGLPENLIEVNIGGINTGVAGANDNNALNFSLSKTIQSPAEGQFIIDGVRGNAAFEIFYQTDGKIEPAYIEGTKDVSDGVTVEDGENDLSIRVDGVQYDIQIPSDDYTAEELLRTINDSLDAQGASVVAELQNGKIRISHRQLGSHTIEEVWGTAKDTIFFSENGEKESETGPYVKLSSEVGDNIGLKKHIFNTAYLGINSVCISKSKYAEKALTRLEEALRMISDIRSDFGSTQNRLEHAIANNENKAENLQYAESVIRDTDMAMEMVAFSNHNILMQAGQAVMAQANQSSQGILKLLQ